MLISDIYTVLQWWFVLFLLGLGFLPLTITLFKNFFDKGYIFSKVIGLGFVSYLVFLFGILHIFPFSGTACYVGLLLLTITIFILTPQRWRVKYALRHFWKVFFGEEILFFCALFFWSYIHSFAPDIHGLEKYMDFGIINSILRSNYFPPLDMWFPPFPVNYYYFGHLMTAVLTKMANLPSNITFNLMMATIFAFCFSQTFSLGSNAYTFLKRVGTISKVRRVFAGLLTACLVTFAGNLQIIYGFFKAYNTENPVPPWQLVFKPLTFPNSYWYPNATRFIYHTIHEFPIYSWTVADLHGHVIDIPFVLTAIASLLTLFMSYDPENKQEEDTDENHYFLTSLPLFKKLNEIVHSFDINPLFLIFIGFLLAVMYMTNAWDGAIYLILTSLVISTIYLQKIPVYKAYSVKEVPLKVINNVKQHAFPFTRFPRWLFLFARDSLLSILFSLAGFLMISAPYNAFFKPFVSGIGVMCAPAMLTKLGKVGPLLFEANHCEHSYWWELLFLYGFFYFFALAFLFFIMRARRLFHIDIFILLILVLSTFLILLPEFIYVKDIYPTYYRANTMFKLCFQAFMMLAFSSSYILIRIMSPSGFDHNWQTSRIYRYLIFSPIMLVLLSLVFTYPYLAINSYYGNLKTYHGLDGTAYLQISYPTDYTGIQWLNKSVKRQPVILEAQGDSYTDYARISANTGLPTVLGWTVHEWLWRGDYSIPAPRINDIQNLYQSSDLQQTRALLKKYSVQYVFIGSLEQQKYPKLNEAKFNQLGKIVFQNGPTRIYQINNY